MKKRIIYSANDHLKELLKDPKFKKIWVEMQPEYELACKLIEIRMKKKLSQRGLAKKVKTTQAVISRIENMNANPSLSLLKRIAAVLETKVTVKFG